ncbi:MAG: cell division protein FtsX [Sphingobium sp.]
MSGLAGSARAAQSRWLPEGRRGPMPWIIAIIIFLTLLAAASGLGLAQALTQMRGELAGGYTVQIVEANAASRAEQTQRVVAYLKGEKPVRSAVAVPEADLMEQLEPWIGQDVRRDELPVPALIDVDTMPGTEPAEMERMGKAIAAMAPSARIESHAGYLAPVERLIRGLMWLAAGLVALMVLVTGAVSAMAARSAHETHRSTIDIMHLLGATDLQVARLFQRRMALDAMFGAAVGSVAAAITLWLLGSALIESGSQLTQTVLLPWRWTGALIAVPIFCVLVATVTARFTVKRALERSL